MNGYTLAAIVAISLFCYAVGFSDGAAGGVGCGTFAISECERKP